MKKLVTILMLIALMLTTGCGGESPIDIQMPVDPPGFREEYCPQMDQWYFVRDCTVCHN